MCICGTALTPILAKANEKRDWRIYTEFAQSLIGIARELYKKESFLDKYNETVHALDANTIDLCLLVFPWAPFRKNKAVIKLQTRLDLSGSIPAFIQISNGKLQDINALDLLRFILLVHIRHTDVRPQS